MLDKFTLSLLNIICESSTPFSYKVFSIDYLTEQARKDLSCDNDMVLEGLNYLFERDYINVKYQDEKEACICSTQKGRLFFENVKEQDAEKKEKDKTLFKFAFIGALLGGVISAILGAIITLVVS